MGFSRGVAAPRTGGRRRWDRRFSSRSLLRCFGIPFTIYLLTSVFDLSIGLDGSEGHLWAVLLDRLGWVSLSTGVPLLKWGGSGVVVAGLALLGWGWWHVLPRPRRPGDRRSLQPRAPSAVRGFRAGHGRLSHPMADAHHAADVSGLAGGVRTAGGGRRCLPGNGRTVTLFAATSRRSPAGGHALDNGWGHTNGESRRLGAGVAPFTVGRRLALQQGLRAALSANGLDCPTEIARGNFLLGGHPLGWRLFRGTAWANAGLECEQAGRNHCTDTALT